MDKKEDWQSGEESSDSFQKMHEKNFLELLFVVAVLLSV